LSLGWKWFVEYQTPHSAHMHGIKRTLHSRRTRFQQIDIVETCEYGRMLVLDGKVQSTVRDEYIYHESLVHPVMFAHPNPRNVLIIGGGEGGTLREVLRHPCVKRAVMVDIDEGVIESSKKYMPELSDGAFEDKRVELVIGDGRKYVEDCGRKFDVIIVDVTDPLEGGPGQLLYTKEFYEAAHSVLRENGLLVTQATSTYYSSYCFATIYRTIKKVFGRAGGYDVWVPAYDSMWGFAYGTKGSDPKEVQAEALEKGIKKSGVKGLRYYSGEIHGSLFVLPKEVVKSMEEKGEIATDAKPTFMPI
jgi:spermidine synthase